MDDYLASNRTLWNNWASIHARSAFYDVEGFKAGKSSLQPLEVEEVGEVSGKSLLHLQCHFGMDTLSWARRGAIVTGVDFSETAIELARSLGDEIGVPANWVHSEIYSLPDALTGQFDIVFTSYGTIWWLPDLPRWAEVIQHFLKPGGTFYIADSHPVAMMFEEEGGERLQLTYPYFTGREPLRFETKGSYADPDADYQGVEYGWNHSLGEIINSLVNAGLRIEFLHELPYISWQMFPSMQRGDDGWWYLPENRTPIPLLFSVKATK